MSNIASITSNNISVKYNTNDWNEKAGKTKDRLETIGCGLSSLLFVIPIVVLGQLTSKTSVVLFFGLIIGMLSMICAQALIEKALFKETVAGYRLLTWFSSYGKESKATISNGKLYITNVKNEGRSVDLMQLLHGIECTNYSVDDLESIKDESFKVEIDTTDKDKVNVKLMANEK